MILNFDWNCHCLIYDLFKLTNDLGVKNTIIKKFIFLYETRVKAEWPRKRVVHAKYWSKRAL